MSEFDNELKGYFGKPIAKIILIIVVIALLYLLASGLFQFWPFSVAAGVVSKVTNPTAIISNYEWFYDQYNAIKASKAKLAIAKKNNMETEAAGIEMILQEQIAEYNSKSKQTTRNLWKAQDLPYQISEGVE